MSSGIKIDGLISSLSVSHRCRYCLRICSLWFLYELGVCGFAVA